jgi:hypothetical protein
MILSKYYQEYPLILSHLRQDDGGQAKLSGLSSYPVLKVILIILLSC